jgi:hypothetical protein
MKGTVLRDDRLAQAAKKFANADSVQKIQLAYPRTGVWSGSNQLGVELPFDPNTDHAQTILKMDEWGMPQIWTVSLGVRFEHELVDGEFFDCTAEIDFGSGGMIQSFDVDWVDGTQLSLPCNFINVRARWNDLARFLGLGVPGGVKVSVLVSQFAPAHTRATFSRFFILPGGASSPLPHDKIPRFAKSLQVLPINPADSATLYGANFEVQFFANTTSMNPVLTVTGTFLGPSVKIPIPPFARYWGVTTSAGAPGTAGWLIFNLFDE